MKLVSNVLLTSATVVALSSPAWGQQSGTAQPQMSDGALEEIIVTARRREEALQDVPTTVNVVTSDELNKLNIREFTEIQTIVPGLTLGGSSGTASVRGIAYNQILSGSNGTIDFYLNDSPVPATNLFNAMYDIGQVEVLRGPQGTLRGRASPSGAITLATRRPDLSEFGGYINTTGTDQGGLNVNGAVNLPLVNDMLAVRLAALYDESDGFGGGGAATGSNSTPVESLNNSLDPFDRSKSGRATVLFEPTDSLSFLVTYQKREANSRRYAQVESLQVANPSSPPSPSLVRGSDRDAVQDTPEHGDSKWESINLQAEWGFAGQRLNYVGSKNDSRSSTQAVADLGDFFGPGTAAFLQGYGQTTNTEANSEAHELRLGSEQRLFGLLDYTVGGFYQELESPTSFSAPSAWIVPPLPPGNAGAISYTAFSRSNLTKERSAFANLTIHLADKIELSGGARYIKYEADAGLAQNGVPIPSQTRNDSFDTTIYTGSFKYDFTDNWMAYALVGTAWRPGTTVVGSNTVAPSPLELEFTILDPEESTSYEIGTKLSLLDNRMALNLALFHQEFDNYPWRAPAPVYFVQQLSPALPPQVGQFNFAGAVPVTSEGVELEWSWSATENWNVGASGSYALGEIDNGLVPCNDYSPRDGVPDGVSAPPTVTQIRSATNNGTISGCAVNYRASQAPLWSATVQSEYRLSLAPSLQGYVRGLGSLYGDSQNDPTNAIDNVDSYGILNLYLGVRDPSGAWEVSLYGKNITETERVLAREVNPVTTSYRLGASPTTAAPATGVTTYRRVTFTAPREFGLNVRYAFGSR